MYIKIDNLNTEVKHCLVIGGGFGFLGKNLVEALVENGCEVRILSHVPILFVHPHVKILYGDIRDKEKLVEACRGIDTVFHVASLVVTSQILRKDIQEKLYNVNVNGTENVIQACQECGVSRLIYTSTNNVVFDGKEINDGNETLPYTNDAKDMYTLTKQMAENRIISANSPTLSTCALRPGGIYGPGDRFILRRLVHALKNGTFICTFGKSDVRGDSVYIDNLVYAHLLAGRQLKQGGPVAGQAYFISDGHPSNYFSFVKPLVLGLGYSYPKFSLPYPIAYVFAVVSEYIYWLFNTREPLLTRMELKKVCSSNYFSIDKAKRDFGYEPIVSQEQGIRNSLTYCKDMMDKIDTVKRPHIGWWLLILGAIALLTVLAFDEDAYRYFSTHVTSIFSQSFLKVLFYATIVIHFCEAAYAYYVARRSRLQDIAVGWSFQTFLLGFPSLRLLLKTLKK
jgi:3beta-hydroxy-delta5-steroid dehydrogenase/steroid delta-isomerase